LFFSKNFPECSVVGFEPIHEMYTKAVNSCSGESRISFRNIALSNSAGTGELSVTANYLSSSLNQLDEKEIGKEPGEQQDKLKELRKEVVRVSTLDIEAENILHPLLLKLDTQGTELQVLEGGKKVLERTEFVLIEMNNHKIYKNTCQYFEVDRFLRASNFQLVDIIVTYRDRGFVKEFDALYENLKFVVPRNS
jgi:FkbM family methyltransferase